jgi:hypothetical protein
MRLASLILAVGLVFTSVAASAQTQISAKEQVASAFTDICLAAQRTGEADLSHLPANAGKLGPNALKKLGFEPDTFALGFNTADGLVVLNLTGSCTVFATQGGGRPFLDAVLAKAAQAGFAPKLDHEQDNPRSDKVTTATYLAPLAGAQSAAIVVSYSKDGTKPEDAMFYIGTFRIEKK